MTVDHRSERDRMVDTQLAARGIADERVLAAMRKVPRHEFVDESDLAYGDHPLPIGHGVTISQPYIVAFMTEALALQPTDRVLEVGTGSGYAAAVLAEIADDVTTVECIPPLADLARERLGRCHPRVRVITGDGSLGFPSGAPYDAIVVTAAAPEIPPPLLDQLAVGGRLVIPVGTGPESLVRITRTADGFERDDLLPVRFVPLTGRFGTDR
jgi:protein-L-isoaspartate(D-aspartate) O-methyltransferase